MAAPFHSATHHDVGTIRRSAGRSAVQIGAYIARARAYDERMGLWHDERCKGGLQRTELVGWKGDGPSLWNAAEAAETRCNALTARHTVLALPAELAPERQDALLRGYALWLRDRYGIAVQWARHAPDQEGDPRNHHGHLVETTRRVDVAGTFREKARELDDRTKQPNGCRSRGSEEMERRRAEWAKRCNAELAKIGVEARVDHRSLERRARDLDGPEITEKPRHLGPALTAQERRYRKRAGEARKLGAPTPAEPHFMGSQRRRSQAVVRARTAWTAAWREVGDWFDTSEARADRDEAAALLTELAHHGGRLLRGITTAMEAAMRPALETALRPALGASGRPQEPQAAPAQPQRMTGQEGAELDARSAHEALSRKRTRGRGFSR